MELEPHAKAEPAVISMAAANRLRVMELQEKARKHAIRNRYWWGLVAKTALALMLLWMLYKHVNATE